MKNTQAGRAVNQAGIASYDIAAISETIGTTATPYLDEVHLGPEGERLKLSEPTVAREVAARLSGAAGNSASAVGLRDTLDDRAEAQGLGAFLANEEPSELAAKRGVVQAEVELEHLNAMKDTSLPQRAKLLSMAGKPIMIMGDASLLAGRWYFNGGDLFLSIAGAASAAVAAVATGTMCGRSLRVAQQRAARGTAPVDCPGGLGDLYGDDRSARAASRFWLAAAALAALLLGGAIAAISSGQGDPAIEAAGLGLLAAFTVLGSTALEAYGTNAAYDRIIQTRSNLAEAQTRLRSFSDLHRARAEAASRANTLSVAGAKEAIAAAQTTFVIADRTKDDPRNFGYESPLSSEEVAVPLPAAVKDDTVDGVEEGSFDWPSSDAEDGHHWKELMESFGRAPIPGFPVLSSSNGHKPASSGAGTP